MNRLFPVAILLLVMFLSPRGVHAQDATPAPDFVTPDPSECTVTPRTVDDLRSFLATATPEAATPAEVIASPTAFVVPEGTPADAETVAAVTATVREVTACLNANAFRQVFALYTDAYMARSFVEQGIAPEAVELFATPLPAMSADEWQSFAVQDVVVLPDGRVGARVLGHSQIGDGSDFEQYFLFREENGRYFVDDIIFPPAE